MPYSALTFAVGPFPSVAVYVSPSTLEETDVRKIGSPRAGCSRDSGGAGRGGMLLEPASAATGTSCLCATAASAAASDAASPRLTDSTAGDRRTGAPLEAE